MANIFWAYEQNEGTFTPLPASPLLLPMIGLLAFAGLIQAIKDNQPQPDLGPAPKIDPVIYERNKKRYYYLIERGLDHDLTEDERLEYLRLIHPPWAPDGLPWAY